VDALEYLEAKFKELMKSKKMETSRKVQATHVAFVTFEKMSSAQIAVQTAHALTHGKSNPSSTGTTDIVWDNIGNTPGSLFARDLLVLAQSGCYFSSGFFQ
ncbi:hypothetical protein EDD16DRAFT_1521498, partial [Pisolithus croceorrhizus]